MTVSFVNVKKWLSDANVKGLDMIAYPTVGKPYGFSLTHTVVGNKVEVYKSTLLSDVVQPLLGGDGKQARELTFAPAAIDAAAQELRIAAYQGTLPH